MGKIENLINKPIPGKEILGSGSYGVVYDNLDGTATKIMRFDTISPDVMIKLKELNLDNFYKILDVLVLNKGDKEYLKAYKMEIIRDDKINLIKAPIDFFITNVKVLMNSIKILSDNYIIVNDLYEDNIIINSDGMFIIDCDLYRYNPRYDSYLIYLNNIKYLKNAIYEHLNKGAGIFKKIKLRKLFKDYDLEAILNKVANSSSVHEYLKK